MPNVRIALKLEGRSGILAALIARLNRHALTFHTHRAEETPDGREIEIDAEGVVADSGELVHGLSAVRGVEDVTDIIVDGTSLLRAPEPEAEPGPETPEPSETADSATDSSGPDEETPVTAETLRSLAAGSTRRREEDRVEAEEPSASAEDTEPAEPVSGDERRETAGPAVDVDPDDGHRADAFAGRSGRAGGNTAARVNGSGEQGETNEARMRRRQRRR